jgi:hypothetical protein
VLLTTGEYDRAMNLTATFFVWTNCFLFFLVGYGDIVPVTQGGKLFATIYILVAGTILLNNMSMISMIPLELRKRRIEQAVLTQVSYECTTFCT